MAKAIKVNIVHTATITKKDLRETLLPFGVKSYITIANKIMDMPMKAPEAKKHLRDLQKSINRKAAGEEKYAVAMLNADHYYEVFDNVDKQLAKVEECLEHGQGLSMYDAMRLELLQEFLNAVCLEEAYTSLFVCIEKWLSTI